MDAVNRRTSMRMMVRVPPSPHGTHLDISDSQIETANNSDKKQYILITPQDISVQVGKTVRVNRMPDPERGQGVLPF